jgi:hypothetical protein
MSEQMELVRFWDRQLSEHCLFSQLGLDDPDLQKMAADLHQKFEDLRAEIPAGEASPDQAADLTAKSIDLATSLRGFLTEVYDRQTDGEWLGWLFPTFVDHIRREGDYFISRVSRTSGSGPASLPGLADELCTWLKFMAEHGIFASHLLDPSEVTLIVQANALSEKFQDLQGGCRDMSPQLLLLSRRAGDLLDLYFTNSGIGTASVSSVIHPVLALHVVREGRMFLKTLDQLNGNVSNIEIPE